MRSRRIFVEKGLYHIYARGIQKEIIFHDFTDYQFFLKRLDQYLLETQDNVVEFCIMPNHYHLELRAHGIKSISKLMHKLNLSYSKYYSKKYFHSGHVFQGRYNSKHIDTQEYLLQLSRYIHRNPLEIIDLREQTLDDYTWSSYLNFVGKRKKSMVKLDSQCIMKYFNSPSEYEEFCLTSTLESKKWIRELVRRNGT